MPTKSVKGTASTHKVVLLDIISYTLGILHQPGPRPRPRPHGRRAVRLPMVESVPALPNVSPHELPRQRPHAGIFLPWPTRAHGTDTGQNSAKQRLSTKVKISYFLTSTRLRSARRCTIGPEASPSILAVLAVPRPDPASAL